jgi:hypothetical protein
MGQDYVKGGGTSSSAQDQRAAMERADAERRRELHAAELAVIKADRELAEKDPTARALAAKLGGEGGLSARMYTHSLGGLSDNAVVVLKVENADGSAKTYVICNLSATEHDGGPAWDLVIVCPSCLYKKGLGVAKSHITLRSWHRKFTLDEKHAGVLWVSPLDNKEGEPPQAYTLAGSIHTHETQTCPTCAYKFEIGPARQYESSEPPCSGAIRSA